MICKVYGYEVNHCACVKEECCMMASCAECLTICERKLKKAVEICESRKNENVEEWAKKLANDVCNADD